MLESRRAPERQDPAATAHQEGKIRRGLAVITQDLRGPYAVGGTFTVADIAIACTLGYVDLRAPELLPGDLRDRYRASLTRPSLAQTAP